jgi:diaminobutyrate-2-oxoglutarate transaminase
MSKTIDRLESNVRSFARQFPTVFKSASGSRVADEQGREYIDFLCSAGSANYGHNPSVVSQALISYIQSQGIQSSLDMMTSAKVDFLNEFEKTVLTPRDLEYRVQFTGASGSSAVEAAIKLARKQTGRGHIVAFTRANHGHSLGSLSLSGNQQYHSEYFGSHNNVTHLPYDGFWGNQDTSELLEMMLDDKGSGLPKPAAVILETVQIAGGINVASTKWLRRIAKACQQRDVRLIVDDSQAGCGRTGQFFSFEHSGIKPDIVCLSKSIGGGLPMSLNLIRRDLDMWRPGEHASTFRGNNLAFVAATAVLQYWDNPYFELEVLQRGTRVKAVLEQIASANSDFDLSIRGRGLIWGLDVQNGLVAKEIIELAFRRGLLITSVGSQQQVVSCQPALTISRELLDQGLEILRHCVADVMQFRRAVYKSSSLADVLFVPPAAPLQTVEHLSQMLLP